MIQWYKQLSSMVRGILGETKSKATRIHVLREKYHTIVEIFGGLLSLTSDISGAS